MVNRAPTLSNCIGLSPFRCEWHGPKGDRFISASTVLLDKTDPSKVIARSREPLIRPEPAEREGYVPNVVYTCGAMRHNDQIILPYAVSDTFCNFANVRIETLIRMLEG